MNQQSAAVNTGDWLIRSIKQNPEGLLLLAAGAALLMRKAGAFAPAGFSAGRQPSPSHTSDSGIRQAAESARQAMSDIASETQEKAAAFASSASDTAAKATRSVSEQSERLARQTGTAAQDMASRILREQPLAVAVAGLAAGAALAAAFPTTDLEKQTLGPIGDQVTVAAQHVGAQLKEATAAAGETLKTTAQERGFSQEGLKKVATEVADSFSNSMSGSSGSPADTNSRS
jgi:hypothetical protein